jgi:hypothetical protein
LVIGGYAVAFHGYPRYTKDIDIWINRSPDNSKKMIKVLNEFGLGSLGLKQADFLKPNQIIQLGYPPNRIDIITSAMGIEFEECYKSKLKIRIDNIDINFIPLSRDDEYPAACRAVLGGCDP